MILNDFRFLLFYFGNVCVCFIAFFIFIYLFLGKEKKKVALLWILSVSLWICVNSQVFNLNNAIYYTLIPPHPHPTDGQCGQCLSAVVSFKGGHCHKSLMEWEWNTGVVYRISLLFFFYFCVFLLLIGSYIFFLSLFLWICNKNQLCGFLALLKEELQRTNLELDSYKEKIKENQEKIKLNKQLPYLVGNIVEVNYQALSLLILC